MKLFYPDIFKDFTCIGSECKDNCCKIGWNIEIDDDTLSFYKSLDDDMGKRLCDAIYEEDGCHYMGQEGGCPFLNEKGLCSVLLKYGEDKISEICAQHPRFYEWFGGYKEAGIGLSCEEVSRLLVTKRDKISFYLDEISEEDDTLEFDERVFTSIKALRDELIKLVQDRNYSINQRLYALLDLGGSVQFALDDEDMDKIDEITRVINDGKFVQWACGDLSQKADANDKKKLYLEIIDYFKKLDYLHKDFPDMLCECEKNIDKILESENAFVEYYADRQSEYENIILYFTYRYLLKAVRDFDVFSKLCYGVVSVILIRLIDISVFAAKGKVDTAEQIFIVKEFSKEVEYSSDNSESLFEDMYCDDRFSSDNLRKLLA